MENGRIIIAHGVYIVSYTQDAEMQHIQGIGGTAMFPMMRPGKTSIRLSNGMEIDGASFTMRDIKNAIGDSRGVRRFRVILEEEHDSGESLWEDKRPS